jgi:hypothetical protein
MLGGVVDMQKKYVQLCVLSFIFLVFIYYTFVFFNNHDRIHSDDIPLAEEIINDFSSIGSDYQHAVRSTYFYFSLDSSSNFNPQAPLLRIDALKIIDIVGTQHVKGYGTNADSTMPYFKDYRNSDAYADVVRRVAAHVDQTSDFPNHYDILGYELKKNEPITRLEFLLLISGFFGKGQEGAAYSDVPAEYAAYISHLNTKGIVKSSNSTLGANEPITREEAALITYRTIQTLQ